MFSEFSDFSEFSECTKLSEFSVFFDFSEFSDFFEFSEFSDFFEFYEFSEFLEFSDPNEEMQGHCDKSDVGFHLGTNDPIPKTDVIRTGAAAASGMGSSWRCLRSDKIRFLAAELSMDDMVLG